MRDALPRCGRIRSRPSRPSRPWSQVCTRVAGASSTWRAGLGRPASLSTSPAVSSPTGWSSSPARRSRWWRSEPLDDRVEGGRVRARQRRHLGEGHHAHVLAALAEFIRELIVEGAQAVWTPREPAASPAASPAPPAEQVRHARSLRELDNTIASIAKLLSVTAGRRTAHPHARAARRTWGTAAGAGVWGERAPGSGPSGRWLPDGRR